MQIELEPPTVELLDQAASILKARSYDEVIVRAVSSTLQHEQGTAADGEQLVERFRKYRGMLGGVSIPEIVEFRHQGLP
jgi:hypothetical protein